VRFSDDVRWRKAKALSDYFGLKRRTGRKRLRRCDLAAAHSASRRAKINTTIQLALQTADHRPAPDLHAPSLSCAMLGTCERHFGGD
jgi:hypothetical protein